MTSWLARDDWSPLLILLAGLLTFAGAVGVGRLCMRLVRVRIPSPWDAITAALLGIQVLSLGVQLLGMAAVATRSALYVCLAIFWVAGTIEIVRASRAAVRDHVPNERPSAPHAMALLLVALSLGANLVIALAPSTKADELYYHMLVPSRLVRDGALHFYLLPWEAAGMPQMGYQLASAPLYAVDLPDAANVMSWALSAMMLWFVYRLLREAQHSREWASVWCAALVVGLHTAVWHVTGGSHAFGELAIAALVIAVVLPDSIPRDAGSAAHAFMIGTFASAGASSKISTIPMAAILLIAGVWQLCRGSSRAEVRRIVLAAIAPGVLLYLPLVAWTWDVSGAPLGPFFSWVFSHSVYRESPIREALREGAERVTLLVTATTHSPLVWAGIVGAVFFSTISGARRALLGMLVLGQALLAFVLFGGDLRFLSGLTFGSATLFALAPQQWTTRVFDAPWRRWLILTVLVAPWALLSLYYARPFARVVFGLESAERFRETYVGYYADYRAIDSLLPANAVLFAESRISSVYAPRPPVWSRADVPRGAGVYQFAPVCEPIDSSFTGADTVYYHPSARSTPYRDPRRPAFVEPLCVRRLKSKSQPR